MNEASNPASRCIKYNRLLQQCIWPITFNKTCIWKVDKLACRIAGIILAMVQSEQVLEHEFVQVLPFIWSLQRNYLNGCIHQGLWLWWYGFSAHLLVCYAMCLWYQAADIVCPLDYFPSMYRTYIENCFFYISHTTIKHSLNSWGGGGAKITLCIQHSGD